VSVAPDATRPGVVNVVLESTGDNPWAVRVPFEALRQAVALGYDDFEYLMKDPDLATLRSSPQLRQLLEQHLASKSRERRPVGP